MVVSGATFPAAVGAWPTAQVVAASDHEWGVLRAAQRFAVADAARGFPAGFDGAALLLRLARQRPLEHDQSPAAHAGASCRGSRSFSQRRCDRQPKCKTTESGGPCGYDAGKKIKGRKRHILTDTLGLLVAAVVHTADIQDRDGAPDVLTSIRASFPWLRHVFADGGYAGEKLETALQGNGDWTLEIIKRSDAAKGFEPLPRRWVVERTFAWFGPNRRLAKDFEETIESSTAWLMLASVQLMTRRLANP
jgi:transposase